MTTYDEDRWGADDFEDTVAAALIACFETKVKKNRGAAPSDRMTEERATLLRMSGPYIASPSRIVEGPHSPGERWRFDVINDPLPVSGCYAARPVGLIAESVPDAYLFMTYVRRANALGKYWHTRRNGTLFEMFTAWARNNGIDGERRYFTVAPNGETWACNQAVPTALRHTSMGASATLIGHHDQWLRETDTWSAAVLQVLADKRFCWTITAQEKTARAHLGCMREEVKSLLYARNLPMTATGRKRPILHLIEAHKRRLRNGTDIDITTFLRGQQVVEIGGTVFRVNPPRSLYPEVSEASRKRYFDPSIA